MTRKGVTIPRRIVTVLLISGKTTIHSSFTQENRNPGPQLQSGIFHLTRVPYSSRREPSEITTS